MKTFKVTCVAAVGLTACLALTPAMADTAMKQTYDKTHPQTAPQQATQPQAPAQTTTANGLQIQPDSGSGPDKTKFKIVSKKEAQKQQGNLQGGGGNSMTGDGTGGGENSSGN